MVKLKEITTFICCALLAITAVVTLFGCNGSEETEETKYDVAIRVKCSDGEIYEFPVGEDEKHITIPYDTIYPITLAMVMSGFRRAVKAQMCSEKQ